MNIMRKFLFFFILQCSWLMAGAATQPSKAQADTLYAAEEYEQAAEAYQQLVKAHGESPELYYNMGNCYYRLEQTSKAVLYYEKAHLLDPADTDIRFNLDMARSKTVDKVAPASEMFFVTWYRSLVLSMSIHLWARLAIIAFVLMLIALAVYLFSPKLGMKKAGFTAAVLLLLTVVVANMAAMQQRSHLLHRTGAVIMAPSVVVKSTPSASGTDLFILHDGTRVEISDATMKHWCQIHLSDGKEGWVEKKHLEVI